MHTKAFNAHFGNVFKGDFFYYRHENTKERVMKDFDGPLKHKAIHGICNGAKDQWFKVDMGKRLFKEAVDQAEERFQKAWKKNEDEEVIQEESEHLATDILEVLRNEDFTPWNQV